MEELPVIVVHGAWVWKLICAACAVGGVAGYRIARRRASLPAIAAIAGLTTCVGHQVLTTCGAQWRERCSEDAHEDTAIELTGTHACAIAAAMPGSRDAALASALRSRERAPLASEQALQQLLGLAELVEGCDGVLHRMAERGRFADMAATWPSAATTRARCTSRSSRRGASTTPQRSRWPRTAAIQRRRPRRR